MKKKTSALYPYWLYRRDQIKATIRKKAAGNLPPEEAHDKRLAHVLPYLGDLLQSERSSTLCAGCRDGREINVIRDHSRGLVVGVDLATIDRPDVFSGDIHDLDHLFAAESFDFVYCCHVLEHCYDPLRAVNQVIRLLRPGGFFYLIVPLWLGSAKNSYGKVMWSKVDLIDFDGPEDVKALLPADRPLQLIWEALIAPGEDGGFDDEYRLLVRLSPVQENGPQCA